jgi:hypothetical protein
VSRWRDYLQKGESICWEGRPAPRAFTFRHWRWSAAALVSGLVLAGLAMPAIRAGEPSGSIGSVLPAALGLLVFWGLFGPYLCARLAWEREFYALTDRRLLISSGLFACKVSACYRNELGEVSLRRLGPALATITFSRKEGCGQVTLACLEHPELFLQKL